MSTFDDPTDFSKATTVRVNSAVYTCFGTLNILIPFLSIEFIRDILEGEISGEAQTAAPHTAPDSTPHRPAAAVPLAFAPAATSRVSAFHPDATAGCTGLAPPPERPIQR
ncbi:hypothetical protein [Burkholderia gladioli]|uniref:hypothetical protein n=1 Tax=Burkholderia gladioli TaxID=28095 RepID=UPI0016422E46|nr:hypothetical protein [Burkholderia gladioli]